MFRWKIAKAIRVEDELDVNQAYHDTDIEIRVWTNKKKKGPGKRVAIVTLTKSGDIFVTSFHKKAKINELTKYQITVAKIQLQSIRKKKMPNWEEKYPYNKK